ncbi:MAG TPA: hypothetical protein VM866_09515 [Pyrinomonadaceae bacterium]|nr:hypothetical protein [Pyrinomonadaceae bacterium]
MVTMTNEQHNKYLGISFLIHGGFQFFWMLLMSLMFFFFFRSFPGQPGEPGPPPEFFLIFIGFMMVFQLIFTVPSIIAGYALLKRKSWARLAGIIGGIVAAMSFPIGTAVCVYAIWFLLGEGWKEIYSQTGGLNGSLRHELPHAGDSSWWAEQNRKMKEETFSPPPPSDWR